MASWLSLSSIFRVKSSGLQHHRESGQAKDKITKPLKNKAKGDSGRKRALQSFCVLEQDMCFEETVTRFCARWLQ